MKLNSIASNQTEIEKQNGIIVFYSYKTPVACLVPGKGGLATNKKYSVTTSRHINQAMTRWNCSKTLVEQSVIDQYAD